MSVRRATCIALAVGTMSFLGSAQALVIDWHTHTGAGGTPYVTSGSNASIVYTFTAPGGQTLKTKAYQTGAANGTGAWTKAQTTIYSGGLGVKYPNSSENCPEHAVDTQGVDDILVFEFGATDYFPVKLGIGWPTASSNCGSQVDQDVKAWVGGSSLASAFDFTGFQVSQLTAANGWTDLGPYNVSVAGGAVGINPTKATGRYLIVKGYDLLGGNSDCTVSSNGNTCEYFKLNLVSADPEGKVPEPGTVFLLGAALAGLWRSRRSKRA